MLVKDFKGMQQLENHMVTVGKKNICLICRLEVWLYRIVTCYNI